MRPPRLYEVRLEPGVAPGARIGTARVRWVSATTRTPGAAEAPVLVADPEASPSDSFALATAAADLAELVEVGDEREVDAVLHLTTYDGIRGRVLGLAERGVPGAPDLLALVDGLEGGTSGYPGE